MSEECRILHAHDGRYITGNSRRTHIKVVQRRPGVDEWQWTYVGDSHRRNWIKGADETIEDSITECGWTLFEPGDQLEATL